MAVGENNITSSNCNNSMDMEMGKEVVSDAWDYKGRPADRSNSGGWKSSAMILGGEACERLTTLGIAVNLVTYLTGVMHLGNAASANTVTNFMGTSFMLCLLGGFIADTFLGRYLTIAIFATIQALGVTVLTISTIIPSLRPPKCAEGSDTCIPASDTQLGVLYLALYLTALGTGGVKASVSGFGTDQFDESNKGEKIQMIKFFNWFFFFISLGSLAAVTILVYIQDNMGRQWGYGICACAIMLALVIFLCGTRRYRFKKLVGSPLTQIAAVFVAAWRKRRMELPSDSSLLFNIEDLADGGKHKKQKLPHSKEFRFLDKASIKDPQMPTVVSKVNIWYLPTSTDVEEVKLVLRMLPIWATTIIFWTIYAQMSTFSVSQATTMDRHIGKSFQIPAASLTVFFVGSILITVPIYDRVVVPIASRLLHNPQGLTPLQRIAVGLVFSIISMISAALVEIRQDRRHFQQLNREFHPNQPWPIQNTYVIREEDELPGLETQTSIMRKGYPQQQLRQSPAYYEGPDVDFHQPQKPIQKHQHQQPQEEVQQEQQQKQHQPRKVVPNNPKNSGEKASDKSEVVFGAVQEHDRRREAMVIKAVDYSDPVYNPQNLRPRVNYMGYSAYSYS